MNRNISLLGAVLSLAALFSAPEINIAVGVDPGRKPARNMHRPSGSKPVPGGGARERERNLRRMAAKAAKDTNRGG